MVVQIYNTVIFPVMSYGLKVSTLTKGNRGKLRRTERRCLHTMLKFSFKQNNRHRRVKELLKGKTITRRIKVMKICYWGHVRRRPRNHMLRLSHKYIGERKKVGRPSFTDKDGMKEAFSKYSEDVKFWKEQSLNKKNLKSAAEKIYSTCLNDTSSEDDLVIDSEIEDFSEEILD